MAKVTYDIIDQDNQSAILSDIKSSYGLQTYISLFSSAGIGCYGFKEENFYCVATVELLERSLKIQSYNHKCVYKSGYICGDMTMQTVLLTQLIQKVHLPLTIYGNRNISSRMLKQFSINHWPQKNQLDMSMINLYNNH